MKEAIESLREKGTHTHMHTLHTPPSQRYSSQRGGRSSPLDFLEDKRSGY